METPTTVKKLIASTPVEKAYVRAEELVSERPLSMLAFSVAAGAAIGLVLPVSRLFKIGVALYPLAQAYFTATKTSATESIVKH